MTISIAAIETDVASIFHAAVSRATILLNELTKGADAATAAVNALAKPAAAILTAVAPQDAAALGAVTGLVNLVDEAIDAVDSAVQGGVTISLPAELVTIWKNAKAGLLAFESVL